MKSRDKELRSAGKWNDRTIYGSNDHKYKQGQIDVNVVTTVRVCEDKE